MKSRGGHGGFVLIGNPGSVRVEGFQAALRELAKPPARVVPYLKLLDDSLHLSEAVRGGDIVRLDSPGRDYAVEIALQKRGWEIEDEECGNFERVSPRELDSTDYKVGRIIAPRQWFLGWRDLLGEIGEQIAQCPPHCATASYDEIACMFDKPRCHGVLQQHGVSVPRSLGVPSNYEDLKGRMKAGSCKRVFLKPAHGSSASGVVAYRTDGKRHSALTTVEMVEEGGSLQLYNSRQIRELRNETEVARLVDKLCMGRLHTEEWLPKASLGNGSFDLRILMIDGEACHTVVRNGSRVITNLHLLNQRSDIDVLLKVIPQEVWRSALADCVRATQCLPGSFSCGIDLMFTAGLRRHAILELNAFGDLLHGVVHEELDAYTAQILRFEQRREGAMALC